MDINLNSKLKLKKYVWKDPYWIYIVFNMYALCCNRKLTVIAYLQDLQVFYRIQYNRIHLS